MFRHHLLLLLCTLFVGALLSPPSQADVNEERIDLHKTLKRQAKQISATFHRYADDFASAKSIKNEKLRRLALHDARLAYFTDVLPRYEKVETVLSKLAAMDGEATTADAGTYNELEKVIGETARTVRALGLQTSMSPKAAVSLQTKSPRRGDASALSTQAFLVNISSTVTFLRQAVAREREMQAAYRAADSYAALQQAEHDAEPYILEGLPELLDASGQNAPLRDINLEESPAWRAAGRRALELLSR